MSTAILRGRFSLPGTNLTAGNAIANLVHPQLSTRGRLCLDNVQFTTGNINTAQSVVMMKVQARNTLSAAVAAAGTSVAVVGDPGLAAPRASAWTANDYFAVRQTDGSVALVKTSSVANSSGTFTATVASTYITVGAAAGAKFWFFGASGDAGHVTFPSTVLTANTTKNLVTQSGAAGVDSVLAADRIDDPLVFYTANSGNTAVTFDHFSGGYQIGG